VREKQPPAAAPVAAPTPAAERGGPRTAAKARAPTAAAPVAAPTPPAQRGGPRATPTPRARTAAAPVEAPTPAAEPGSGRATPAARAPTAAASLKRKVTPRRTPKGKKKKKNDSPKWVSLTREEDPSLLEKLSLISCQPDLTEYLRAVVCSTPVGGMFLFKAAVKANQADSFRPGVAEEILKGPFVQATMHVSSPCHACLVLCSWQTDRFGPHAAQRTGQWSFEAEYGGEVIFKCKDEDYFLDQLLNRFDRGYYLPLYQDQRGVPCSSPLASACSPHSQASLAELGTIDEEGVEEEGESEAERSDAEDERVEPLALTPNRQRKRAAAAEVRE
jgi:hypothetical protein